MQLTHVGSPFFVTVEASGLPLRSVVMDIDNDGFNDVLGMGDEGGTVFLNDGYGVLDPRTLVDCACAMTSVQDEALFTRV